MMIEIQSAASQHIAGILPLNELVQKMHAESLPAIFKYPVDSYVLKEEFLSKIANDDHHIFVALINGEVVGYIWAEHKQSNESALTYSSSTLYIHHIAVSKVHRRNKVGESLMKRANELAKSLEVDCLALDVWSFNSEAEKFFKENKFSGYNQKMWKWQKN